MRTTTAVDNKLPIVILLYRHLTMKMDGRWSAILESATTVAAVAAVDLGMAIREVGRRRHHQRGMCLEVKMERRLEEMLTVSNLPIGDPMLDRRH